MISVIGLGYVGLPLAITFAEKGVQVIGFDISEEKINAYKQGKDPTHEVGDIRLSKVKNIEFTNDPQKLLASRFHIIAVPTPVCMDKVPDLAPLKSATKIVGKYLEKESIIVYESTVYPGVTEDICVPILEETSGLEFMKDFKVAYSPERINPGDLVHTIDKIVKVVSACDEDSLEAVKNTYELITDAGVYVAPSIKVAEAAKVIENAQRDINIAFINEIAIIFDKMGIDTKEVLKAAETKWNFLKFQPGLVGGHCIGIDPYYLTFKAQQLNYRPEVILAGRHINDSMGQIIVEKTIKQLINGEQIVKGAKVLIMGLTFKEDTPDLRNSKVKDIVEGLKAYNMDVFITDPIANEADIIKEYGIKPTHIEDVSDVAAVVICVKHKAYQELGLETIKNLFKDNVVPILIDVKGLFNKEEGEKYFSYWRL